MFTSSLAHVLKNYNFCQDFDHIKGHFIVGSNEVNLINISKVVIDYLLLLHNLQKQFTNRLLYLHTSEKIMVLSW